MKKNLFARWIVLIWILFLPSIAFGNSEDRIKDKIQRLLKSAEYFRDVNIDSSNYYAGQAYKCAEDNDFDFEIAEARYNIGIIHCMKSEFDKGKECFDEALSIQKELGNEKEIAILYNAYGQLYRFTSEYAKALKYLFKACTIKEKLADELSLAVSYNSLCATYRELTDFPSALEYGVKAHDIALRLNDTIEIIRTGISVANVFYDLNKYQKSLAKYEFLLGLLNDKMLFKRSIIINNIANIQMELADFISAERCYKDFFEIAVSEDNYLEQSAALLNLGHVCFNRKEYNEANDYYLRSEQLSQKHQDIIGFADAVFAQGLAQERLGLNKEAIKHFSTSMEIFQNKSVDSKLVSTYMKLNEIYSKLHDYKTAHIYLRKYIELHELIDGKEKNSFQEAIVMKAEAENEIKLLVKDLEYQRSQYEALIQTIIISGILVSVIVLILVLFYRTKKKLSINKTRLSNKEEFQKSIYSQMSDELKMLHLYVSYDIAKIENKENYNNISASFANFSKKYSRIMSEMKANNN